MARSRVLIVERGRNAIRFCAVITALSGCGGGSGNSTAPIAAAVPGERTPMNSAVSAAAIRNPTLDPRYRILYFFGSNPDGALPEGNIIDVDGILYGTTDEGGTFGCGTVFRISKSGSESVLHNFGCAPDGSGPQGLVDVGGTIYGATNGGGTQGNGAIFSLTTSGEEHIIHSFTKSEGFEPGYLTDVNGDLYGTTLGGTDPSVVHGSVYRVSTSGHFKLLHGFSADTDGDMPDGKLIEIDGTLYGATVTGGTSGTFGFGGGTVYSIDTSGNERVIYRFGVGPDGGTSPAGGLVNVNGTIYGTTLYGSSNGGAGGSGTVFSLTPSGVETIIHTFTGGMSVTHPGEDGSTPTGDLIDVNGTLYGTTEFGGSFGIGSIFSITPAGTERIVHSFGGASRGGGQEPVGRMLDINGTLYGSTDYGHDGGTSNGPGLIFSYTP
jgi:uncharacterized repeat protein (TIGR03803 family)